MSEPCLYTWTDIVNHACHKSEASGAAHTHHVCPCGASTIEARHSVEVERYHHGAANAKRYRAACECGWIGGACDHHATARADGEDHLRETATRGR